MTSRRPSAGEPRSRALLVLLLLLIVGLPLAVVGSLLGSRAELPATSGDQPGGRIEGRVLDAAGRPIADLTVRLLLLGEEEADRLHEELRTGSDGHFAFSAPPCRGKYALSAGGDEFVQTRKEVSFLDGRGAPIELEPLELRLEPGCVFSLRLVPVSERYDDSGRFELRGRMLDGWGFGLIRPALRMADEFEDGKLEIGGLPPMEGTLRLFLDNGDELELQLRLEAGYQARELEL